QQAKLTRIGEQIQRIPLHPRLARMLVAADGARSMAQACALLSERHFIPPRTHTTTSDLLSAIDDWQRVPLHVQRVAREIEELVPKATAETAERAEPEHARRSQRAPRLLSESDFLKAVVAGYPDRVAQRREAGSPRVRLASGAGAVVASESGVRDGEFLVALDVRALQRTDDAAIRVASLVEREWLRPTSSDVVHRFDSAAGVVKALVIERYDALVLAERHTAPDPEIAAPLLANAWLERGPADGDRQLLRRLRFAGRTLDVEQAVRSAARHATSIDDLQLARVLPADVMRALDRDAPETLVVPSGRTVRLEYSEDGSVSASVKLQELFGLGETPRVGPRREPVLLALLAPNGPPVQLTRDLRSFWDRTYPEVRKELRGRYPK